MKKFSEFNDDSFSSNSNKNNFSQPLKLIIGVVVILVVIICIFMVYNASHKRPTTNPGEIEQTPTPVPSSAPSGSSGSGSNSPIFASPSPTPTPTSTPKEVKTEEITKEEATALVIESNISTANRKLINDLLAKKKSMKEITNDDLLYFAYKSAGYSIENGPTTISQQELKVALAKTVLGHKSIEPADISATGQVEYYYTDADLYTKNAYYEKNANDDSGTRMFCLTSTFKKEAAGYTLKAYCVYNPFGLAGSSSAYYSTYEAAQNLEDPLFENTISPDVNNGLDYMKYNPISEMKKNFKKYKNKMSTVTYTFVKRNGRVYLTNYKVVSPK